MNVFAALFCSILFFGELCAYSDTNAPAPTNVAIEQDSDFDGIPDSKDPYPIIASYSVFKWEVTSASLDYDVQQTTTIGNSSSSENSTTKSIKGSFSWAIGADGKIEADLHGSVGLNANPFKGFGLSVGINAEGGVSTSNYSQERKAKTIDDNEINSQREFFEIKDSEARGNLHFTFSVNFRNLSKYPLIVRMASLPIVIGDRHIANAKPEDINPDGILELPPNRREGVLVMFRADMNNTKAMELVNWLKNGNSPTINLARSALSVYTKNDAAGVDYVSRVNDIETHDSLLTVRSVGGSVSWRIASKLGSRQVTVRQAMTEINKMLRSEGGASSDFFVLSEHGLVNIAQLQTGDGVWGGLDNNSFTVVDSNMLNACIPEQLTLTLLDRNGIRADLNRILEGIVSDNMDKLIVSFMCRKPMWQYAADKSWPEGQCLVGLSYSAENATSENISEGMKWFRKSADQDCAPAQFFLGYGYYKGEGVMKNLPEAVKWFTKSAVQGMPQAQNFLGVCYENGEGVAADLNKAFNWYEKSAKQGCAGAQANLGGFYCFGLVVKQDKVEAAKLFRKAGDRGIVQAQFLLGRCYYNGDGVTEDKVEAVKWFRKAADLESASAQYFLGTCFYKGEGVTQNKTEAVRWFRKAAEHGLADAQSNLGVCYDNGDGVAKDTSEALRWYQKAAEQGSAMAQYILGFRYFNGQEVTEDKSEALRWFRKSAEQGLAMAQFYLGRCYFEGAGVTEDRVEAVNWIRKASDQGYDKAQYALGISYLNGYGVAKNRNEAINLFRKSSSQGFAPAAKRLQELGE